MARRRQRVVHAAAVCFLAVLGAVCGAGAPVAAAAPPRISLERVTLSAPAVQVPQLQALGIDVTEDVTRTAATVLAASDRDRRVLREAGFVTTTLIPDLGARRRALRGAGPRVAGIAASGLPSGRITYRTPAEVQGDLDALVATHPGLVRRIVLPRRSIEGREITGVEIAANVNRADDGRPVYVVMGLHHAREWASAEIATEFARDLADRQAEPRIAALLAGLRIIVVPVVNPDAYAYSRGTAAGGQPDPIAATKRRNCRALPGDVGPACAGHRGVDLNRNYAAFWGGPGASTSADADTYRGAGPWSEPEAAAVHELTQRLQVTGVQSLHNVAALILRPPGFRALGLAPDEARLKALGDAMAAATGYDSRYGYELYEVTGATEDWNYVAQGAFGYTIELGGAFPGDPDFQGTFQTHVVDQYLGRPGTPAAGKGVREALLLAAEEALDARDHIVLRGRAPAGTTLRLHKRFDTVSSPLCSNSLAADACGPTAPALSVPDLLDTTLTVGEGSSFVWHAGPSTRPFVRKGGARETWTLTCERGGAGSVSKAVFADRGQTIDVNPCDRSSLPRPVRATQAPAVSRVSARAVTTTLSAVRHARRLQVALRCPVACRARVTVTRGSSGIAERASIALAAGRRTTVGVPLTADGQRRLAGSAAPRHLTATIAFRTAAGNSATVTRTVTVPRG
ncbi:MAG: hypothetical protein JWN65_1345 [Solirubrobacterales bacterium]|nr:hypothetical protein [Solirubrobacterales bacterium]